MSNSTNLLNIVNNNTYAQTACNAVNTAREFVTTQVGNLGSHMVSQFNSFKTFVDSDPSYEKKTQIVQRIGIGSIAALSLYEFGYSLYSLKVALSEGKKLNSLGHGLITLGFGAATYALTSYTLNPAGLTNAFKTV